MTKHNVMASFSEEIDVDMKCLRCKQSLEYNGQLEEPWFLEPKNYSCDCKDDEYWYVQLRYAPHE